MKTISAILIGFLGLTGTAAAQSCPLSAWMTFKGTDLLRNSSGTSYAYVTAHKAVDADGAPNAYHPDDVGKACFSDPNLGLDCPQNAGYPTTSWWNSVLVPDPSDPSKAFVQKNGEFKGFFVTQTWLADPSKPATDPARFVDSTKVPYMVFPGTGFGKITGTGFKGDLGFAVHIASGKSTAFIVADQGGGSDAKLGEGSLALFNALGGSGIDARRGNGLPEGDVLWIVFPGSRKQAPVAWPRTNADIAADAEARIASAGGLSAIAACF